MLGITRLGLGPTGEWRRLAAGGTVERVARKPLTRPRQTRTVRSTAKRTGRRARDPDTETGPAARLVGPAASEPGLDEQGG